MQESMAEAKRGEFGNARQVVMAKIDNATSKNDNLMAEVIDYGIRAPRNSGRCRTVGILQGEIRQFVLWHRGLRSRL